MTLVPLLSPLPAAAQTAGVTLLFREAPTGEVLQDSLLRFRVVPAGGGKTLPDGCGLYRGPSSAGNRLEGHPDKVAAEEIAPPDSAGRIFRFRPSDTAGKTPKLGLGFHHLVAACRDGQDVSPEIPLLVVSRSSAAIATPKSLETSASPGISWSPVPGVPAYHLLLSDQPLEIDTKNGSVGGASVIWQAITTGTSIAYGTPDPSGNFDKVAAPPLSPGVAYNLVILNNYDGRSALATSSKAQALKLFSIQAPAAPLSKPRNLAPAPGSLLSVSSDSAIRLRWSASRSSAGPANTYKAYIYSLEEEDGSEILVPIWSTEVTDTTALVDARRTLLSKRYVWKVFALGSSGTGVVGDTTSFTYRNDVQTLSISVTAAVTAAAGGQGLGDVRIEVTPVDGGASPIPLFTPSGGEVEKVMAVGQYVLRFAKDGYASQTRAITLADSGALRVDVALAAAAGRIVGRVVDAGGLPLVNARVAAVTASTNASVNVAGAGAGGTRAVEAVTDAKGSFLLGVDAGVHAISISKADYASRPDTLVAVAADSTADLGVVALSRPQGSLAGTVANDKGAPLSGCQVVIRASSGAVLRTLLTDDKGGFSAYLAPGSYTVAASRTGFTAEEKAVRLADAASLAFRLVPGASVVKGRVSIRSWPTAGSSASLPAAGAGLELRNLFTGAAQKANSDLRGDYTFSADTGTFLLKASDPGRARSDSVLLRIGQARSTVIRDLELRGLAAVKGTVALSPSAPAEPSAVTVSLLRLPSLAPAGSVPAMASGGGGMAFSLEGIPDGDYRVTCGLAGYGLDAEPTLSIRDGVWIAGIALVLRPAGKSVTFTLRQGAAVLAGRVGLSSPLSAVLPAGSRLSPAAPGTYVLGAAPDSLPVIPLTRMTFGLPASGPADTAVDIPLPFSHEPPAGPLAFRDGTVSLELRAAARIDSAWIVHGYGSPADTFRVPASQLAGSVGGPKTLRFDPGARGGLLSYYFILRSGSMTWSNGAPDRRFRAVVEGSRELAFLRISGGDSLPLPARSRVALRVHAYDAAGRRIDTAVDRRGKVEWETAEALAAKLESRKGRAATLATGAARPPAAKAAASARPASGTGIGSSGAATRLAAEAPGTGGWDSLKVSVTLDGATRSLSVPARVVAARINRLVLGSSLGETPAIPSPAGFGLFVSAFDTTTSPPTPLVPSPSIALDPPEAGEVRDLQVHLHPRFIGPLRIRAVHANPDGTEVRAELGEGRDSLLVGLNVGQTLRSGDTARLLVHDREFEMRVPDSALAGGQAVLRMFRRGLAKSFASGVSEAVSGRVYEISNPSGAAFAKPFRLNLGIPAGFRDRKHALRRFHAAGLEWASPADSSSADTTLFGDPSRAADIALLDGHYYALLAGSRGLSAGSLEIVPNPFSPFVTAVRDGNTQPGARIRLRPDSDRSSEVTVSIRIYNMDGELIRILVDHKTIPKAAADFYWDGKADGGRWARNGRYLAKITLKAAGSRQVKHILRPVVVFQ